MLNQNVFKYIKNILIFSTVNIVCITNSYLALSGDRENAVKSWYVDQMYKGICAYLRGGSTLENAFSQAYKDTNIVVKETTTLDADEKKYLISGLKNPSTSSYIMSRLDEAVRKQCGDLYSKAEKIQNIHGKPQ